MPVAEHDETFEPSLDGVPILRRGYSTVTDSKPPNPSDPLARNYLALHRDYVHLLRQVEHLSTLREIGLAVNSTLDLEEMLSLIAEVVQGALDIRRLTIYEVDTRKGVARPLIAKYGADPIGKERLQEESISLKQSELGELVNTRRVLIHQDALRSEAFVPLIAKNAAVGIMRLEEKRDGSMFSQDDVALFKSVGAQIAVALNNAQLYALAVTDGLTGLYVRRYFDLRMEEEFDQALRYRRVFSLLLFDIDHFKKFNDTYGHQTGDSVLQQFAEILRSNTRRSDICCRYGGEEMAVILPETLLNDAVTLAEKLRAIIEGHGFTGASEARLSVTSSIGVSSYCQSMTGPADMVQAVDNALYRAKSNGRNRVELASSL